MLRGFVQNLGPQLGVHALHHVPGLALEQGVAVGAVDKGIVTLAALVRHAGKVGVPLLAVLAHNEAVVVGVGGQEVLGIVVGVHNDLAQRIVHSRVVAALTHQVLQERVQQLQPVALLDLQSSGIRRACPSWSPRQLNGD